MTPKQFKLFLQRDNYRCVHCGAENDTLVPQHRIGRQSGGSKLRNVASNIIVLCSAFNGLIEADADAAALARKHGIKLNSWQEPETIPVWYAAESAWYLLDNEGNRQHWLSE